MVWSCLSAFSRCGPRRASTLYLPPSVHNCNFSFFVSSAHVRQWFSQHHPCMHASSKKGWSFVNISWRTIAPLMRPRCDEGERPSALIGNTSTEMRSLKSDGTAMIIHCLGHLVNLSWSYLSSYVPMPFFFLGNLVGAVGLV